MARRCQPRQDGSNIDAMLFECAICFAVASLMLIGMFGLLVRLADFSDRTDEAPDQAARARLP